MRKHGTYITERKKKQLLKSPKVLYKKKHTYTYTKKNERQNNRNVCERQRGV